MGNPAELKVMGSYSNGQKLNITENITWQSNDNSIAVITNKGLITPQKTGSVSISANYEGKPASASLEIINPKAIDKIIIDPSNVESSPSRVVWFTAKAVFKDGTSLDITKSVWITTWTSDNGYVASIIGFGVSSGRAWTTGRKGTAKITKTYKDNKGKEHTAEAILTVK